MIAFPIISFICLTCSSSLCSMEIKIDWFLKLKSCSDGKRGGVGLY